MKLVYMRTDFPRRISEQQFWQTFREWRLRGISMGDSGKVAEMLGRKRLAKTKQNA